MAKRRKNYKKSSGNLGPLDTFIDLAGAAAFGAYVKHKVKRDFARGEGEASAKAAAMAFGAGSLRSGSSGIINLGGMIGLNSALKDINKAQNQTAFRTTDIPFVDKVSDISPKTAQTLRKNLWREYCEDGSSYNIDPMDYDSADDYEMALNEAKNKAIIKSVEIEDTQSAGAHSLQPKYVWRKYCPDGSKYGLSPENYENADDYEEALEAAKLTELEE